MKLKKFTLLMLFSAMLFPITTIMADESPENLYTGNSAHYLCSLNQDEQIIINLTLFGGTGNFSMYLLNSRPQSDNTNMAAVVGSGLNISYNATNTQIYYVQVKLVADGPAVFELLCNVDLTRYFILQIPGFPFEFLIVCIGIGFGLVFLIRKRRMKISNNTA